jgi:3-dehydroquinate synthase
MVLETVTVGLGDRSYQIILGQDILSLTGDLCRKLYKGTNVAVVTNPVVGGYYLERVNAALVESGFTVFPIHIQDGEAYKNLETLKVIYDQLVGFGFDRRSLLLALGGGVVGDITGFAAATFLRGVPFVQVPTTLLAQVDSSVGGKTGVNHEKGKNLIGAFYQPGLVLVDTATLDSLPEREYLSGLAEIVKYGVVLDGDFFDFLSGNVNRLLRRDKLCLNTAIKRSCEIKASIVIKDEKESGLRAVLNYGHTLGHAVETLTGYNTYTHGEAVAIGMAKAASISESMGLANRSDTERICTLLKALGLPVELPLFTPSAYIEIMLHDKKVKDGGIDFVFNKGIGDYQISTVKDLYPLLKISGIGG